MAEDPTFEPRDGSPTIHVNVRTIRNDEDRQKEVERMWNEHAAETEQANLLSINDGSSSGGAPTNGGDEKEEEDQTASGSVPLYGQTKYDLTPVTTYEYDVVACEDYRHDPGCWVRNKPKEIREANPDFVPS